MKALYTLGVLVSIAVVALALSMLNDDTSASRVVTRQQEVQTQQEAYVDNTREVIARFAERNFDDATRTRERTTVSEDAPDSTDAPRRPDSSIASALFYAVVKRDTDPQGKWTTSYDIYAVDPTNAQRTELIAKIPTQAASTYESVWIHNGAVYSMNRNREDAIVRLSRNGFEPFITAGTGRIINDVHIGYDGRWYVITSDKTAGERAGNSVLEIYEADGTHVRDVPLKEEESPLYASFSIAGVSGRAGEKASKVFVREYGGDAGAVWGDAYAVDLRNDGTLELVANIRTARVLEVRPDGAPIVTLVLPDNNLGLLLPDGSVKTLNIQPLVAYWADREHIVWTPRSSSGFVYITNVLSQETVPAGSERVIPHTLKISANRRYAFAESAAGPDAGKFGNGATVLLFDLRNTPSSVRTLQLPKREVFGNLRYGEAHTEIYSEILSAHGR